jgi:hypothetical protein
LGTFFTWYKLCINYKNTMAWATFRAIFSQSHLVTLALYYGGIRSLDPQLQSPRWQAETIPLDHAARAKKTNFKSLYLILLNEMKLFICKYSVFVLTLILYETVFLGQCFCF